MTTAAVLAAALSDLAQHYPDHVIGRNAVGNLVFYAPGELAPSGWIDLLEAEWTLFD